MKKRLLLGLLIALLAVPGIAHAQETATPETTAESPSAAAESGDPLGGGDNLALAVNTKDDSSLIKFAFDVRRIMNGAVDDANAAVAVASCENCLTIAVAIQLVMITGDPEVVTPTNLALALNVDCLACETFASAYQYVFTTGGNVRFTGDGQQAINDIRKQIADLLEQGLDFTTLDTELGVLVEELYAVVDTELMPVGRISEEEDTTTGSPAPSDTTEVEPTPSDATDEPSPESTSSEPEPSPSG